MASALPPFWFCPGFPSRKLTQRVSFNTARTEYILEHKLGWCKSYSIQYTRASTELLPQGTKLVDIEATCVDKPYPNLEVHCCGLQTCCLFDLYFNTACLINGQKSGTYSATCSSSNVEGRLAPSTHHFARLKQ